MSVIVFGSFARREAEVESDIDIDIVRPTEVDKDDDAWSASIEAWRRDIRRLTGNPVEILEMSADEAGTKLSSRAQAWADIRRDGRVVYGLGIDELRAVRSA